MKSLVVDDDVTSRLVLEEVLSRFGGVDSCSDGNEAVRAGSGALQQGKPYDLICMDLLMPTMNGLEALQLIRQEEELRGMPRASKVIVITSSEDTGSIQEAFHCPCDAYLVKPVNSEELLNVVEYLCRVAPLPA